MTMEGDADGGDDYHWAVGTKQEKKKKKKHKKEDDQQKRLTNKTKKHRLYEKYGDATASAAAGRSFAHDESSPSDHDAEEEEEEGPVVVMDASELAFSHTATTATSVSNTKRTRYDSSSDVEEKPKSFASAAAAASNGSGKRRRRYDSSDDDDESNNSNIKQEDDNVTTRTQQFSTTAATRKQRYDSSEDDNSNSRGKTQQERAQPRRRYDSSSEEESPEVQQRATRTTSSKANVERVHDSSPASKSKKNTALMSSGNVAGLQHGTDFSRKQARLEGKRRQDAQRMVDQYGMGETVYRDAAGKRLTAKENDEDESTGMVMDQQQQQKEQQRALNKGRVQKELEQRHREESLALQHATFARHVDDAALEASRQRAIRAGDPMAKFTETSTTAMTTKKDAESARQRPVYKGPPAKPNRYGIRPGFRWDGVDRGNGFEDKLLAKQFEKQHTQEQAYRYQTADM